MTMPLAIQVQYDSYVKILYKIPSNFEELQQNIQNMFILRNKGFSIKFVQEQKDKPSYEQIQNDQNLQDAISWCYSNKIDTIKLMITLNPESSSQNSNSNKIYQSDLQQFPQNQAQLPFQKNQAQTFQNQAFPYQQQAANMQDIRTYPSLDTQMPKNSISNNFDQQPIGFQVQDTNNYNFYPSSQGFQQPKANELDQIQWRQNQINSNIATNATNQSDKSNQFQYNYQKGNILEPQLQAFQQEFQPPVNQFNVPSYSQTQISQGFQNVQDQQQKYQQAGSSQNIAQEISQVNSNQGVQFQQGLGNSQKEQEEMMFAYYQQMFQILNDFNQYLIIDTNEILALFNNQQQPWLNQQIGTNQKTIEKLKQIVHSKMEQLPQQEFYKKAVGQINQMEKRSEMDYQQEIQSKQNVVSIVKGEIKAENSSIFLEKGQELVIKFQVQNTGNIAWKEKQICIKAKELEMLNKVIDKQVNPGEETQIEIRKKSFIKDVLGTYNFFLFDHNSSKIINLQNACIILQSSQVQPQIKITSFQQKTSFEQGKLVNLTINVQNLGNQQIQKITISEKDFINKAEQIQISDKIKEAQVQFNLDTQIVPLGENQLKFLVSIDDKIIENFILTIEIVPKTQEVRRNNQGLNQNPNTEKYFQYYASSLQLTIEQTNNAYLIYKNGTSQNIELICKKAKICANINDLYNEVINSSNES